MHPLEVYYLRQACRGQYDTGIGPIYSTPTFLQREQGIGNFCGTLFRWFKPVIWKGAKAFRRETSRIGGKSLSDIAENRSTEVSASDIVSIHVTEYIRYLITKLGGSGQESAEKHIYKYKRKTNKKLKYPKVTFSPKLNQLHSSHV